MEKKYTVVRESEDTQHTLERNWMWKYKDAIYNREERLERVQGAINGIRKWISLYMLDIISKADIEWNTQRIKDKIFKNKP